MRPAATCLPPTHSWAAASRPWLVCLCLLSVCLLFWAAVAGAQGVQAIPELTARVMDRTGTLQPGELAQIEAQLQALEGSRGVQIVVLMVATTAPEDIADYTQRVGERWKIGRKEVGDGLLLVIAKNDRSVRIAPAKALEGAVPDLAARQIIEQHMAPRFREGDFAGGIAAALEALRARLSGETLPAPRAATEGPPWGALLVFLVLAVPLLAGVMGALLGRKAGALLTGAAVGGLAAWLGAGLLLALLAAGVASVFALASGTQAARRGHWSPGGWGGPSGWGGSGGGFRSGGGGDFGGGGASGRW